MRIENAVKETARFGSEFSNLWPPFWEPCDRLEGLPGPLGHLFATLWEPLGRPLGAPSSLWAPLSTLWALAWRLFWETLVHSSGAGQPLGAAVQSLGAGMAPAGNSSLLFGLRQIFDGANFVEKT